MAAAREALNLARKADAKNLQARILKTMVSAGVHCDQGQAITAAQERAKLLKELGDRQEEAAALLELANVHRARLGAKLSSCSIPSVDDTMGALRSAKDSHSIFAERRDANGKASALRLMAQVLLLNGVHPNVVEACSEPEEIIADVMSGKYSSQKNALPQKEQPGRKLEDVIPDAKQLDRGKFSWTNPCAGYCYACVWQPVKDRPNWQDRPPRGQYDILTLGTGWKHNTAPTTLGLRSNQASERNEAMVVFMTTPDAGINYATSLMNAQHTLGGMVAAQLRKMTFVQFGESFIDPQNSAYRHVEMHQVTLALLRSARIEAPFLSIGFVGGDTASWMTNPSPIIDSIFTTIESADPKQLASQAGDECEMIWKQGEAYAPSLVHKVFDEQVSRVKPGKGSKNFR
eukprot:TRINITY_DN35995_c0_g1_i1.p1 TRINITY_DN35995_c0_g1~~TRINITY_DN35995_c0_g1_i1.p1  ORF type:complete len:422 (-),score=87.61 TRINITY_DN35995_c0_g1_i1:87-1295(-)